MRWSQQECGRRRHSRRRSTIRVIGLAARRRRTRPAWTVWPTTILLLTQAHTPAAEWAIFVLARSPGDEAM